jgi:hypothetical protein
MMNGEFLNQQARLFAARLKREAGGDTDRQVRLALSLATSRPPTDAEVRRGVGLIQSLQAQDGASPDAALDLYCLLVLNLNEFVYLD